MARIISFDFDFQQHKHWAMLAFWAGADGSFQYKLTLADETLKDLLPGGISFSRIGELYAKAGTNALPEPLLRSIADALCQKIPLPA